ncbi:MAG TPA: glycosyltransferase family 39 protein [Solirubrobacteraceae bacterium]|nr:glycosyltransferase family 39 protein [Solirubrobacteraceae bacterium]
MQTGTAAAAAAPRRVLKARTRAGTRTLRLRRPELIGLILVSAVLNLWDLSRNGWANEYYAAAVRSMSRSWHDFLFASLDPNGVMTVDKPPLALWVQALSARIFGFSSLSILIPQALMGVATVVLVYDLVRRRFGRFGGAVAGFALALTPITVAVSRHNNPDALLALCCVAALWCAVRGMERGRTGWLVASGVLTGLAFETKMLVALVVVPAIAVAWLWTTPAGRGRLHALRQLLYGGAAMVVVGGAWPALVELTPAADRPWVSGTSNNTILSLIFEYNGLGRVEGQTGGPGGAGLGGGTLFGGSPGPLRLLNSALGGQDGWLFGFALVAVAAVLYACRLRRRDERTGWIIAVAGTFATTAVLFSFAGGIFHPYYVALLAPFTAALVGAGAALLAARDVPLRIFAPLAAAAGVLVEIVVHGRYPGDLTWLPAVLIVIAAAAAAAILIARDSRTRGGAVVLLVAALLVAPAIWSVETLGHRTNGTFPMGGPASLVAMGPAGAGAGGRFGGGAANLGRGAGTFAPGAAGPGAGGFGGRGAAPPGPFFGARHRIGGAGAGAGGGMFSGASLTAVVDYVRQHGGGEIAVASQSQAATAILDSGGEVAGIGGFSGRESTVGISWLADRVRSGAIRWVLAESGSGAAGGGAGPGTSAPRSFFGGGAGGFGGGFGGGAGPGFGRSLGGVPGDTRVGSRVALDAAAKACVKVATTGSTSGTLYDCAGRASELEALARESAT